MLERVLEIILSYNNGKGYISRIMLIGPIYTTIMLLQCLLIVVVIFRTVRPF